LKLKGLMISLILACICFTLCNVSLVFAFEEFNFNSYIKASYTAIHETTYFEEEDATCVEDGHIDYYFCSLCEKYYMDNNCENEVDITKTVAEGGALIPKLGHTIITDARVEPTLETNGKTEGSHCSTCNEVVVKQYPIFMDEITSFENNIAEFVENGITYGYVDIEGDFDNILIITPHPSNGYGIDTFKVNGVDYTTSACFEANEIDSLIITCAFVPGNAPEYVSITYDYSPLQLTMLSTAPLNGEDVSIAEGQKTITVLKGSTIKLFDISSPMIFKGWVYLADSEGYNLVTDSGSYGDAGAWGDDIFPDIDFPEGEVDDSTTTTEPLKDIDDELLSKVLTEVTVNENIHIISLWFDVPMT